MLDEKTPFISTIHIPVALMDIEETMVHLTVDIGGRPGVDCRGFCAYCYFKHVKDVPPFGCRYCLPFLKGCDYFERM